MSPRRPTSTFATWSGDAVQLTLGVHRNKVISRHSDLGATSRHEWIDMSELNISSLTPWRRDDFTDHVYIDDDINHAVLKFDRELIKGLRMLTVM